MTMDELLQDFVNKDYDEIKVIAQIAVSKVVPLLKNIYSEDNVYTALIILITSCVAADGNLSANEQRLMRDIMGVEPEEASNLVKNAYDYDFSDKFFDSCSEEVRKHLTLLVLSFLAVDERISKNEIDLLKRLLSY